MSRFELNVSRFAAYKAFDAYRKIGELDSESPDIDALKRVIAGTYNSYNLAEIKAVVTRSRNARQWIEFEESAETYPNLEWLPSNAVHPREEHRPFYNKIIAKTDPFWNENQPGNIWGCKCGWKETEKSADKAPESVTPSQGMSGNPAKTGEIFSKDASYFKRNWNDEAQKTAGSFYYSDSKSKLNISVMADANEIADNVRTGRTLLKNFKDMELSICPHLEIFGVKNPEYEINGLIADAKRVNNFSGVASGFAKAKKQGSEAIIIDLHNIKSKGHKLNIPELASGIVNRAEDFRSGNIKECYVVWGDKCTKIEANMFNGYDKKDRYDYIGRIRGMLHGLE